MNGSSLADLVKSGGEKTQEEKSSTETIEEKHEVKMEDVSIVEELTSVSVETTNLSDWFSENNKKLENINEVKAVIKGVNPKETLIFTVADPKGGDFEGFPKRKLCMFEDANTQPVLNLPPRKMLVFNNNSFMILYAIEGDTWVKCYGVKTGMILTMCINVDNTLLVPFKIEKASKKEKLVKIDLKSAESIKDALEQPVDKEALSLYYKQVSKSISEITTKGDTVRWLMQRQLEINDINHLLQIDSVILQIF